MDDLNYFNGNYEKFEMRIDRVLADLPARSEILFFKASGYYFCHLCAIPGESVEVNSKSTTAIRYPLRRVIPSNQRIVHCFRDIDFWNIVKGENLETQYGMTSSEYSPILKQNWNPTPTDMGSYDSMHCLYEGILRDMMSLIQIPCWEKFDKLYLQQKFPSFLHRHPRSITKNLGHLKAIEVYMIVHYYLDLFYEIEGFEEISKHVSMLKRFVNVLDKLHDCFRTADLPVIINELWQVLEEYQQEAGIAKTTQNFHIASELGNSAELFGPLVHNSAFLGEILNFTLTKAFISSNSARYAIMFFDMAQLCDIYELSTLRQSECVCGNYVLKTNTDVVAQTDDSTESEPKTSFFKIKKSTQNSLELENLDDHSLKYVPHKNKLVPCVSVYSPKHNQTFHIPMHKNVNQYI
ncbi:hypothetical protein C9374_005589 [Naegleria lovaniensis]|uniref:Uncharacterized protein n=1 Tax=Naegleria lovaniensis TaxID=51637 RepID=A0AA88GQ87_NAELO|nr:uncharacterized protein C9374_005589 [Naegleria lovaniensis]KAG2382387.1 hypothetical protein C9374_005589 [Naegleria lovaniensis]